MSVSLALHFVLSARIDTANVITFLEYCKLFSMLFFAFQNKNSPVIYFKMAGMFIFISNYLGFQRLVFCEGFVRGSGECNG